MLQLCYEPDSFKAATNLSERLNRELANDKRVLWLVCGGSNIPLAVEVMRNVPANLQTNLTLALTDERFGEFGHSDSNWQQLDKASFEAGSAHIIPTLVQNLPLAETCENYERSIVTALSEANIVIAQFGIGPDGHIAGILPHSPAITEDKLVVGYDAGNFIRITLTPPALRQISIAFAFVYGESKLPALENLQKVLPLTEQPAQILKQLPESYIYNDQIGDTK